MHDLLEARKLNAWYGRTQVLFDLDFSLESGKITTILGANGAGKTTVLRAICRMVQTTGSILFDGEDVSRNRTETIVRRGIAHVPEMRGTFSDLTVEENLRIGGYARKDKSGLTGDIDLAFSRFPVLKQRRNQQAGTLSGGEQQMLAISRALMLRPRLLLLDEPSFGLAPMVVTEIFGILKIINSEENVTIFLVEQNAKLALEISEKAYLLETGRIVLSGRSEDLAGNEDVQKVYLGI